MKLLLVLPDANMHKLRIFSYVRSFREAPLTLATLAGLLRDQDGLEIRCIDESVDEVPLEAEADLVGISVMTGTARRAYALADHFRQRGIPVVLGGVHVSLLPDEASGFADSIVIGMGDEAWPRLIEDFKEGRLESVYREEPVEGDYAPHIPPPDYSVIRKHGYMVPYTVQATRGCIHKCDFCTVPVVCHKFLRRPVEDVIRDIKNVPARRFVINDVSPIDDPEYAKELFEAMIPLGKKWGGLATTKVNKDRELFDRLVESGCQYLLIGFESIDEKTLKGIYKGFNKDEDYEGLMKDLHGAGIIVQGCFVFGFDHDDNTVFARTVDRVQELRVDIPRYSIYTPYPGTTLFKRLEEEGRILSYDWADYDTMHVVYKPKLMSPARLYEGFRWAYRETFKISSILQRTWSSGFNFPITFVGNLTYRIFVKRLFAQKAFEMPVNNCSIASTSGVVDDTSGAVDDTIGAVDDTNGVVDDTSGAVDDANIRGCSQG